jgi:hypothetical protein
MCINCEPGCGGGEEKRNIGEEELMYHLQYREAVRMGWPQKKVVRGRSGLGVHDR